MGFLILSTTALAIFKLLKSGISVAQSLTNPDFVTFLQTNVFLLQNHLD